MKHIMSHDPVAIKWWRRSGSPDIITCLPVGRDTVKSYMGTRGVAHVFEDGAIKVWPKYDPFTEHGGFVAPDSATMALWLVEGIPTNAPTCTCPVCTAINTTKKEST